MPSTSKPYSTSLTGFILKNSVKRSLTKGSKEEAISAHASVATISQIHSLNEKRSTGQPSSKNTIGCSEENRTFTKLTSSVVGAARGVTTVWMIDRVFTARRL